YDSMPRNAIAAGCVDFVLPPAEIARELGLIAKHPSMVSAVPDGKAHTGDAKAEEPKSRQPPSAGESSLKKILRLLRNHGGVDFSLYKSGTLPIFHYALKPGGFLFLGASESIGPSTDLFEPTDKKHKIYVKRAVPTPTFRMHFAPAYLERPADSSGKPTNGMPQQDLNIFREADRVVLDRFSPPCVLVDENLQILQFRGDTSAYLKPRAGRATLNLFKMTRESLNQTLRAMIHKCQTDEKPVRRTGMVVSDENRRRTLTLEVIPFKRLNEQFYLILFEEESVKDVAPPVAAPEGNDRISELQRELAETREEAQLIQQRYDNAHESLQAFNEEIQSGNEELQSINEELETSKEELESTANGIFRSYANVWKAFFPKTTFSMTSNSRATLRASVAAPCCSTLGFFGPPKWGPLTEFFWRSTTLRTAYNWNPSAAPKAAIDACLKRPRTEF
ncbi:MAG: hypothetical protein WCD63_03290, partial [Terrimicrobiaceae bacterium]